MADLSRARTPDEYGWPTDAIEEIDRLREQIARIFRDRREPDKVAAYCMEIRPELAGTAAQQEASDNGR